MGTIEFYITEYTKLKDEQIKRIGFRDNLFYVLIGCFVGAAGVSEKQPDVWFVMPFICITLGYQYFQNDKKISHIGYYIKKSLVPRATKHFPNLEKIFFWETFRFSFRFRKLKKLFQLFMHLIIFIAPGIISVSISFKNLQEKVVLFSVHFIYRDFFLGFFVIHVLFVGLRWQRITTSLS